MRLHDIAVVGASGLVGRKILQLIEEREFPAGKIIAIASDASYGKEITVNKKNYKLHKLGPDVFKNLEFAFFSAGGAISLDWAPIAAKSGAVVIDNSSAFRMEKDVPLVVPEVNRDAIFKHKGIIANPNCSTIQLVVALKPLDNRFKIKRVIVSTYQSVSGIGNKGVTKLHKEIKDINEVVDASVFPHKIAFNAIPQIDVFYENGYTKEEMKVIGESRKIMGKPDMKITCTCVRIPTLGGHGEAVNIEFEKKFTLEDIRLALAGAPGITLVDDPSKLEYPMPSHSDEKDDVFVGRIREDESIKNGLNMWIVSDNIRKGAATNAVQIAEELLKGK
jgi:aspartate-semialdehyde dehydrogenase